MAVEGMKSINGRILAGALLAVVPLAAGAEVRLAQADAMLIEHRFTIAAPAEKAWESLVHPEFWWPEDHTWSGDRRSLSLAPVAAAVIANAGTIPVRSTAVS